MTSRSDDTAHNRPGLGPARRPRAADAVSALLRRRILTEMQDGERLPPEAVLMEQYGIARQSLRDAFRVLETEGLLTVRRGVQGGAVVHRPDGTVAARNAALFLEAQGVTLMDVYQARAMIEPPCAAILARRSEQEDVDALRAAVLTGDDAGDPVAAIRAHMEFHRLVIHLAGNQTVALLTDLVRRIIEVGSEDQVAGDPSSHETARALRAGHLTHLRLIELIERGDVSGAEDLWMRHVEGSEDYLVRGAGSKTVLDVLG
ncbi:FadR family transcriptional regulator [Pseudonocardia sp. KRD-184]|uniref:FadR family transcriptional regulator n=1 Tax=Pseudonocardia oceani TaxID=2792013 RepID=A0ABS6U4B2_9PSEU|nr:FCD domain-containing protein [Pseudonocardia oceani]MBW0090706.1 FadR family transcriptional regulator [Pseudonocardia oceani]MBW0097606.1 FadR family transcriptional regulator [Pseudonocardia oceani]MBW0124329.1 FadR family transcriptional regulator [Pseudonocardia oceani]MBW0127075.1 FadR family transcriptional regulator [Pseudonocardia oceani]